MLQTTTKLSTTSLKFRRHLTSKMSQIKTFVFLDLETTGLPHMEHNTTKITEMCVVAVQADHIELGCFPRVHNKLNFCFNPNKPIHTESTDITGLSNELLQHQASFSSDIVEIIKKWLETNKKPICLVAHNGNRFDYPILRAEIEKTGSSLPEDLLCVDSLNAFRALDRVVVKEAPKEEVPFEFDDDYDEVLCQISEECEKAEEAKASRDVQKINETTPTKQIMTSSLRLHRPKDISSKKNIHQACFSSYKLTDVYTRLTSKPPMSAHEAEGDVVMLITCAAVLGERFVAYANEHSVKFSGMPVMRPGKRIGM